MTLCVHLSKTHGERTAVLLDGKRQSVVLCATDNGDYEARKEHVVICVSSGGFISCGVWAASERILERSW